MTVTPKNTEGEPWHVTDVPSEHLDNGMASIVEMVDDPQDSYTVPIKCRIDDDGFLREMRVEKIDRYVTKQSVRLADPEEDDWG